jgi:3-hydroxy-9,10-secoandrosta-1,3,5(10)-triene-9,17-dione monooxygenase
MADEAPAPETSDNSLIDVALEERRELLRQAIALAPRLKERARQTEEQGELPAASIAELRAAGLFQVAVPARYGGRCDDLDLMYDIAFELGRACGSTAWCYAVWGIHSWIAGHFPEQAQEEYFATGPDVLCSSGLRPGEHSLQAVEGGYVLGGRWRFSSGANAATWAVLGANFPDGVHFVLLPRSNYQVIDTWIAAGLAGTNSNDIVVEDAFVPAYRTLHVERAGQSDRRGWVMHGRPSYNAPLRAVLGWDLVAPLIGMAQGVVDRFAERALETTSATSSWIQVRFGEASAKVDAARVLFRATIDSILGKAARGEPFSAEERARYLRDKALMVKLCLEAVDELFEVSGGLALLQSEPLQRLYRDAHAAAQHAALLRDPLFEVYGRQRLVQST